METDPEVYDLSSAGGGATAPEEYIVGGSAGVAVEAATGTVVFSAVPESGQKVTIDGVDYIFYPWDASGPWTDTDIVMTPAPNAAEVATIFAGAVNNWRFGGSDENVTAEWNGVDGTVTLTAKTPGPTGNEITLTTTTSAELSGARLEGGTGPDAPEAYTL